jgi:hypothetical protein
MGSFWEWIVVELIINNINMIKKHLELKTYTFNGVEVLVKINYDKGLISLCEKVPHPTKCDETTFQDKRWLFSERGLEYMNGWKEVLHAMEYAIESASNELKSYKAEVQKENEASMSEILDLANEMVKGKKSFFAKKKK